MTRPLPDVWALVADKLDPPREHHPWDDQARPEQLPPEGDWLIWLLVTGRRWGKSRTAAEWLRRRALDQVGTYAICAPTYGDVRDVCVEGGTPGTPSGLLSICHDGEIDNYNRSLGEIVMVNGSKIKMLSADEPDRARGWGFHAAWCDEFSSWRYPSTWYETLLPAVTMADCHRFIITTTPKPNHLTKEILKQAELHPEEVRVVRGRTVDNAENLGEGAVEQLRRQMTERQARQELYGELLDDIEGALWTWDMLDDHRHDPGWVDGYAGGLGRVVIGVDPAGTAHTTSDETGIIVVAKGLDDRGYVLADRSMKGTPTEWATAVLDAKLEFGADRIVAEKTYGGDMVKHTILTIDPNAPVTAVDAMGRSKWLRAEPIAALYEQGRVSHLGTFPKLEEQMTQWTPESTAGTMPEKRRQQLKGQQGWSPGKSPDRIDALVYAMHELFPPSPDVTSTKASDRRLSRGYRGR